MYFKINVIYYLPSNSTDIHTYPLSEKRKKVFGFLLIFPTFTFQSKYLQKERKDRNDRIVCFHCENVKVRYEHL